MVIIAGTSDLFLSWISAQVECPLQHIIMLRRSYTSIGNLTDQSQGVGQPTRNRITDAIIIIYILSGSIDNGVYRSTNCCRSRRKSASHGARWR